MNDFQTFDKIFGELLRERDFVQLRFLEDYDRPEKTHNLSLWSMSWPIQRGDPDLVNPDHQIPLCSFSIVSARKERAKFRVVRFDVKGSWQRYQISGTDGLWRSRAVLGVFHARCTGGKVVIKRGWLFARERPSMRKIVIHPEPYEIDVPWEFQEYDIRQFVIRSFAGNHSFRWEDAEKDFEKFRDSC